MNKLIKLQLRNIFHNRLFYSCLILILILFPIISFWGTISGIQPEKIQVMPQVVRLLSTEIGVVSTIFITVFTCFDFGEGTSKNIIARGYSKGQFFRAKFISALIGLFTMYIVVFIVDFVLFIGNGLGYEANMPLIIISNIVKIIAYTMIFVTVSFVLEKNASAIIACVIGPSLISTVLGLVDSKLKFDISKFWIGNISSQFAENPTTGNLTTAVILYIVYIVVFAIIGLHFANKKEIK